MTALDRYAKLEAVGWYVPGPDSAGREVVLSFGARSLMIAGLDDVAIAHWPLASLRARGAPDTVPVELVPDPDSAEHVSLDDDAMVAAIREVCPNLHADAEALLPARARGRPWTWVLAGAVALALGAGAWAAPRLDGWLKAAVPAEEIARLGEALAPRVLARLGAPPRMCIGEEGRAALAKLAERLGGAVTAVAVIDHGAADALALPGGRVLLLRGLIDAARGPEDLAGVLAHEASRQAEGAPTAAAMDGLGWTSRVTLAAGGQPDTGALERAAEALAAVGAAGAGAGEDAGADTGVAARSAGGRAAGVRKALAATGLPARPFAGLLERLATGPDGAAGYAARHPWLGPALAEAAAPPAPYRPALSDRDWLALATICERTAPLRAR